MRCRWALGVALATGLSAMGQLTTASPSATLSMSVTPEAGRALARHALDIGNPDLALRVARQVLAADPEDVGALMLLTAALTRTDQAAEAVSTGRKAFGLSVEAGQKFEAAYLTAAALSALNRPYAAKFWLRRADNYRAKPAEKALLTDAFQKLDARTPLTLHLSAAGGPSDNVNGGSLHDSFDFDGIPLPIAQALPGATLTAAVQASYQLAQRPTFSASVYATALQRNVWLSERAHVLQPGAQNSDYLYQSLDLGASAGWVVSPKASVNLDLRAGETWQGGTRQQVHERLMLGTTRALSEVWGAHLDLTADAIRYPGTPNANTVHLSAEASLRRTLGAGRLRLTLGLGQVNAEAAGIAYRAVSTGADWTLGHDVFGVNVSLFGQAEMRTYWKTPTLEPDIVAQAGVTAAFPSLSRFGFSPTLTLNAQRSVSQVVVRDTSNVGLTIGIASAF